MKDSEYIFAPGQWTFRTCYTGGCGSRGVSRVKEGLEDFMYDRQDHKWIQKCLGKAIPCNVPNRTHLEEVEQGTDCSRWEALVLTLNSTSQLHCWRHSLRRDELQLRPISYVLQNQLKRHKNTSLTNQNVVLIWSHSKGRHNCQSQSESGLKMQRKTN